MGIAFGFGRVFELVYYWWGDRELRPGIFNWFRVLYVALAFGPTYCALQTPWADQSQAFTHVASIAAAGYQTVRIFHLNTMAGCFLMFQRPICAVYAPWSRCRRKSVPAPDVRHRLIIFVLSSPHIENIPVLTRVIPRSVARNGKLCGLDQASCFIMLATGKCAGCTSLRQRPRSLMVLVAGLGSPVAVESRTS